MATDNLKINLVIQYKNKHKPIKSTMILHSDKLSIQPEGYIFLLSFSFVTDIVL